MAGRQVLSLELSPGTPGLEMGPPTGVAQPNGHTHHQESHLLL